VSIPITDRSVILAILSRLEGLTAKEISLVGGLSERGDLLAQMVRNGEVSRFKDAWQGDGREEWRYTLPKAPAPPPQPYVQTPERIAEGRAVWRQARRSEIDSLVVDYLRPSRSCVADSCRE